MCWSDHVQHVHLSCYIFSASVFWNDHVQHVTLIMLYIFSVYVLERSCTTCYTYHVIYFQRLCVGVIMYNMLHLSCYIFSASMCWSDHVQHVTLIMLYIFSVYVLERSCTTCYTYHVLYFQCLCVGAIMYNMLHLSCYIFLASVCLSDHVQHVTLIMFYIFSVYVLERSCTTCYTYNVYIFSVYVLERSCTTCYTYHVIYFQRLCVGAIMYMLHLSCYIFSAFMCWSDHVQYIPVQFILAV